MLAGRCELGASGCVERGGEGGQPDSGVSGDLVVSPEGLGMRFGDPHTPRAERGIFLGMILGRGSCKAGLSMMGCA